jgi:hypothetical protein
MNIDNLKVRLINFLTEDYFWTKAFWHKRWVKVSKEDIDQDKWLTIGPYEDVLSKSANPNWRLDQKWILLNCSDWEAPFYVFYKEANGPVRRTLIPVRTFLFAMRISEIPLKVRIRGTENFYPSYKPTFVSRYVIPLSQSAIMELVDKFNRKITFI